MSRQRPATRRPQPVKHPTTADQPSINPDAEELYLWEHASLLFHSYEWQAAADAFLQMAGNAKEPLRRVMFSLNTGIILGHIGEYDAAATILRATLEVTHLPALCRFLLALAETERKNLGVARDLYCNALYLLPVASNEISYSQLGLDFRLTKRMLLQNETAVKFALSLGDTPSSRLALTVSRFPGGLVFEPPTGECHSVDRDSESDNHSSRGREVSDAWLCRFPSTSTGTALVAKRSSTLLQWTKGAHNHVAQEKPTNTIQHIIIQPDHGIGKHRVIDGTRHIRSPHYATSNGAASVSAESPSQTSGWRRRIRGLYNRGHSVHHRRAHTIDTSSVRWRPGLSPRDARVRTESVCEMAKFIRHSGPGRGQIMVLSMLMDDLLTSSDSVDHMPTGGEMAGLLQDPPYATETEPVGATPSESVSTPETTMTPLIKAFRKSSPRSHRAQYAQSRHSESKPFLSRQDSPHQASRPSSAPSSTLSTPSLQTATLQILQPLTYKPCLRTHPARSPPSGPYVKPNLPSQAANPLLAALDGIHTPGSP